MLAVMGPSGSGKTTMLNVLSKKVPSNLTAGTIKIGSQNFTKTDRAGMGFVFQDDLLLSNLSVRETIMTSAQLKLPVKMPTAEKAARVSSLIDILGLSKVSEQRIGSMGKRGISGGERKRTAVGNELVTSPSVLFLDEPTSGLDSTTALQLVQTLRKLCDGGMTIICCIHQPRENIFSLFDQLLLLADGRTAYFGPAAGCGEYLESLSMPSGEKLSLPPFTTVADWILDLMSKDDVAVHIEDMWAANQEAAVVDAVEAMRCREKALIADNVAEATGRRVEIEKSTVHTQYSKVCCCGIKFYPCKQPQDPFLFYIGVGLHPLVSQIWDFGAARPHAEARQHAERTCVSQRSSHCCCDGNDLLASFNCARLDGSDFLRHHQPRIFVGRTTICRVHTALAIVRFSVEVRRCRQAW